MVFKLSEDDVSGVRGLKLNINIVPAYIESNKGFVLYLCSKNPGEGRAKREDSLCGKDYYYQEVTDEEIASNKTLTLRDVDFLVVDASTALTGTITVSGILETFRFGTLSSDGYFWEMYCYT